MSAASAASYLPRLESTLPSSRARCACTGPYSTSSSNRAAASTSACAATGRPAARSLPDRASRWRACSTASASCGSGGSTSASRASVSAQRDNGRSRATSWWALATTLASASESVSTVASRSTDARCRHPIRRSSIRADCSACTAVASQVSVCIATQASAYASSSCSVRFHASGAYGRSTPRTAARASVRRSSSQMPNSFALAPSQRCDRASAQTCTAMPPRPTNATPVRPRAHCRRLRLGSHDSAASRSSIEGQRSLDL